MKLTVAQLAEKLGAQLVAKNDKIERYVKAVAPVEYANKTEITFVTSDKHKKLLHKSKAAAAIVNKKINGCNIPQLVVKDVGQTLIKTLNIFAPKVNDYKKGVDDSAKIGNKVKLGKNVSIGPFVVIDDEVEIGDHSVVKTGCKIGQNSKLGKYCRIDSNVVIYHNCYLGNHVIVQANTTIGSIGFGYLCVGGQHQLIPHNGGVVIEDGVEIGANCCIDRAKFGNTIIGAGTKIDNLVQIAHNVVIGKCCLIAAQVGIAGSSKVGDGVVIGGQAGLTDNIKVGSGTMIGAQAGVMSDVGPGLKLAWTPAIERNQAVRAISQILRLPKLTEKIKNLTKRIETLEQQKR